MGYDRKQYRLYVCIFPAEGGPRVAFITGEARRWENSEGVARDLIQRAVEEGQLVGAFFATWQHCYGDEPPQHSTPFESAPVARPIAVRFS
jgi:hypothetical protein